MSTWLLKKAEEIDSYKTQVLFLLHEDDSEVFAYFPNEVHGRYRGGYAHTGQHTTVSPEYADECREVAPEEYAALKRELEGLGYNLEVLNRTTENR